MVTVSGGGGGGGGAGGVFSGANVGGQGGGSFSGNGNLLGGDPRDRAIAYLKDKISEDSARISNLEHATEDATKNAEQLLEDKVNKRVDEFKKELVVVKESFDQDRIKVIEVIGIFVSIFTFVSAEVTIMKSVCAEYWVGFSFILLGGLSFFVLLSRFMISSLLFDVAGERDNIKGREFNFMVTFNKYMGVGWWFLMLVVTGLFALGIFLVLSVKNVDNSSCSGKSGVNDYKILLDGGDTNVRISR